MKAVETIELQNSSEYTAKDYEAECKESIAGCPCLMCELFPAEEAAPRRSQ